MHCCVITKKNVIHKPKRTFSDENQNELNQKKETVTLTNDKNDSVTDEYHISDIIYENKEQENENYENKLFNEPSIYLAS